MNFNADSKVKDIALTSPSARHVLEESGVDYCCGGSKTLTEACSNSGVSSDDILRRLEQARTRPLPGDSDWLLAPLAGLTRHIREKHHAFVRQSIPRVQSLLAKVKNKHGQKHPEIAEVEKLFLEMARELTAHMQKEEMVLFPYIDLLEHAVNGNLPLEAPFFGTVRHPIHSMLREHDAAGDLLRDIRRAAMDFVAPSDACTSFHALYQDLREFEEDLHEHVHLENNILFPRAIELESSRAADKNAN